MYCDEAEVMCSAEPTKEIELHTMPFARFTLETCSFAFVY